MNQDISVIFDREFALNQLSGNAELLQKMLDRFAGDYASMGEQIKNAIDSGDLNDCRQKAHTIKGVAGNLGFWNLHHHAKLVEDAAKENEAGLTECHAGFEASLLASIAAITEHAATSDTEAPVAEPSSGNPRKELSDMLNAFEFIAPDQLQKLLDDIGLASDTKTAIISAVNDLDYPTAISLLESN